MSDESSEQRPIDRIRQKTRDRRQRVEVEDWDLILYFGPLTTADVEAVEASLRDDGKDPDEHRTERRLRLLVEKAELEDGSSAFRPGDVHHLRNEASYVTLQQVIGKMFRAAVDVDEAKKESVENPTSGSD